MKFFGHGELFLESLRQVVDILSRSPDYKGGRTGRYFVCVSVCLSVCVELSIFCSSLLYPSRPPISPFCFRIHAQMVPFGVYKGTYLENDFVLPKGPFKTDPEMISLLARLVYTRTTPNRFGHLASKSSMVRKMGRRSPCRVHGCYKWCLPTTTFDLTPAPTLLPHSTRSLTIVPSEIVERVLCKASRTTSGSDSYFTVEQLFTNSDYLLKPRAERLPPINVEVRALSSCSGECVQVGSLTAEY